MGAANADSRQKPSWFYRCPRVMTGLPSNAEELLPFLVQPRINGKRVQIKKTVDSIEIMEYHSGLAAENVDHIKFDIWKIDHPSSAVWDAVIVDDKCVLLDVLEWEGTDMSSTTFAQRYEALQSTNLGDYVDVAPTITVHTLSELDNITLQHQAVMVKPLYCKANDESITIFAISTDNKETVNIDINPQNLLYPIGHEKPEEDIGSFVTAANYSYFSARDIVKPLIKLPAVMHVHANFECLEEQLHAPVVFYTDKTAEEIRKACEEELKSFTSLSKLEDISDNLIECLTYDDFLDIIMRVVRADQGRKVITSGESHLDLRFVDPSTDFMHNWSLQSVPIALLNEQTEIELPIPDLFWELNTNVRASSSKLLDLTWLHILKSQQGYLQSSSLRPNVLDFLYFYKKGYVYLGLQTPEFAELFVCMENEPGRLVHLVRTRNIAANAVFAWRAKQTEYPVLFFNSHEELIELLEKREQQWAIFNIDGLQAAFNDNAFNDIFKRFDEKDLYAILESYNQYHHGTWFLSCR
ncbi:MAG TPA: hypothetical protein PKI14_03275 [Fervidobacterium sp.]|nr:hypothetical protein [Fervidobacterium sp.]